MSNNYYIAPSEAAAAARAKAADINSVSQATDSAFDLIPADLTATIAALVAGSGTSVSDNDESIDNLDEKLVATGTFTETKTSPYTVTVADLRPIKFTINSPGGAESYSIVSDVTFTNDSAVAELIFNLPLGAEGYRKSFRVTAAQYLRVKASGTEVFRFKSSQSAAGGYVRSNNIGTCFTIEFLGGEWLITGLLGALNYDE